MWHERPGLYHLHVPVKLGKWVVGGCGGGGGGEVVVCQVVDSRNC